MFCAFQCGKISKIRYQFKLATDDFQDFNDNEPLSVSNSGQSSVVQESVIETLANSEISINEFLVLENPERFSRKEQISVIEKLLKILTLPRSLIRKVSKLSKKNRVILLSLLKIAILAAISYYVYYTVFPILMSALRALNEKIKLERSKLKQRFNNSDQVQESKEFWDNHLGSLNQIIKINRGGSLVAIREVNIYNFSELDQQQDFLSSSSTLNYIEFERSKLEVEKFIVRSCQKRLSLNTLKKFPSKLNKLKKFIPLRDLGLRKRWKKIRDLRPRKRWKKILLGATFFLMLETGNPMFERTRRSMNFETVSTTKVVVMPALPVFESSVDKVLVKVPQTVESILTETKDIMKTPSRLGSEKRARKRAKLVRLADLPPLSEQNFDREIESITNAKPTAIKIGLN